MDYNFLEDSDFISERARLYLIKFGIKNEFEVSRILNSFYGFLKNHTVTDSDRIKKTKAWDLWIEFLDKEKIKPKIQPGSQKQWSIISMVPQKDIHLESRNRKGRLSPKLSPLIVLFSLIFWTIIYYILIFKIIKP